MRIGERVVKSTTGYDLLRFLMHSDGQFGEPVDFVLRLRPHCGMDGLIELSGPREVVTRAMTELLQSCWMNWFDSVDVVANAKSDSLTVRIAINTPADEWHVFETMLTAFASAQKLAFNAILHAPAPIDGCPDFALKTTPDRTIALASELAATHGIKCLALCYNGVVHGYLNDVADAATVVQKIVQSHATPLHESGGDWHSPASGGSWRGSTVAFCFDNGVFNEVSTSPLTPQTAGCSMPHEKAHPAQRDADELCALRFLSGRLSDVSDDG